MQASPQTDVSIVAKTGRYLQNHLNINSADVSMTHADYDVIFKIPQPVLAKAFLKASKTGKNMTVVSVIYSNDHLFSKWDDSKQKGKKHLSRREVWISLDVRTERGVVPSP